MGDPKRLMIFEAPIDALSYLTLHPETKDTMFFAMDGLKPATVEKSLQYFYEKTGRIPEQVAFGVDNDPAGHNFFDKMVSKHAHVIAATGEDLPYLNMMVDDRAIPADKFDILRETAKKYDLPWEPLAALEKAETNFNREGEISNSFGFDGGFIKSQDNNNTSTGPDDYVKRVDEITAVMDTTRDILGQEKIVNLDATVRRLQPDMKKTNREQFVEKIVRYADQYSERGAKPVNHEIKDWNDRLKQAQNKGGFGERMLDRIFSRVDGKAPLRIERRKNDAEQEKLFAVNAFDRTVGYFEADSPQEMAFLIKSYGYNAVDKEDEHRYQKDITPQKSKTDLEKVVNNSRRDLFAARGIG